MNSMVQHCNQSYITWNVQWHHSACDASSSLPIMHFIPPKERLPPLHHQGSCGSLKSLILPPWKGYKFTGLSTWGLKNIKFLLKLRFSKCTLSNTFRISWFSVVSFGQQSVLNFLICRYKRSLKRFTFVESWAAGTLTITSSYPLCSLILRTYSVTPSSKPCSTSSFTIFKSSYSYHLSHHPTLHATSSYQSCHI